MTDALGKLQKLLKELFQIETAADLDFGIYRVMNHKRSEIECFVDKRLPEIVEETLSNDAVSSISAQAEERRQVKDQIRENFGEYAITPSGELSDSFRDTPLGKRYLALPPEAPESDSEHLKASIFNHLYTFFSRYYDGGDFLSKRRYSRRQKYAVPYNGEEVYLHWANSDQYYVKTGSYFLDYSYEGPNGVTVRFRVVSANIEHDNVKEADRRFVPRLEEADYDDESRTLTVPFDWRPLTDAESERGQKQTEVDEHSVNALLARFEKQHDARYALEVKRGEGNPVSLLAHHLRHYTAKHTSDFFIHKDLKGFLEGELDFYLKNEILDVDDLERWMQSGGPEFVAARFETLRAMKRIGREIIAFLGQIEDFQKKLFEKKKFVVYTGYCLTLDNVPEELYEEITANDVQYKEWRDLFDIDGILANLENGNGDQRSVEWLRANPHLVLDTRHFDRDFEDRLLGSIEDLDEKTDGLLINSENFQALNLLQERYREQVKCIYIDPPYNTGDDGFLYKDNYQHSSWLAMMQDRLQVGHELLDEDGIVYSSIDDHELLNLCKLLGTCFGEGNHLGNITWRNVRDNNPTRISVEHEYVACFAKDVNGTAPVWKSRYSASKELLLDHYNMLKEQDLPIETIQREYQRFLRDNAATVGELERYKFVDEEGPYTGSESVHNPHPNGYDYEIFHPETGKAMRKPANGYRFPEETMRREYINKQRLLYGPDENRIVKIKLYLKDYLDTLRSVVGLDGRLGAYRLNALFGKGRKTFDNPKPVELLERLVSFASREDAMILDFFAGSGTTGHAAIDLNRKYGDGRKYILVEVGEYFDSVLKPRIQKVIYSHDWKDGKPQSRDTGASHIFKYMTLESYEDALNNISFDGERGETALDLYHDEYLLRYMLDFETRDSQTLLNVGELAAPFDYRLTLRDTTRRDGETQNLPVDLPETFAYLLGMRVRSRKTYHDGERRYLVYRGPTPERDEVAVIWRRTTGWQKEDYERDRSFVAEKGMAEGAKDLFVNGDSLIPEARPLEATFKKLMLTVSAPESR